MDRKTIEEVIALDEKGEAAALSIITGTAGSTPRKAGTKMLVTREGIKYGTVGGGCGEAEVKRAALDVLDNKAPARLKVDLTGRAAAEGMVCGGVMEVFIDYIEPGDRLSEDVFQSLWECFKKRERAYLITVISGGAKDGMLPGNKLLVAGGSQIAGAVTGEAEEIISYICGEINWLKPQVVSFRGLELFIEPVTQPPELLILGGGHISLPLAGMAHLLGYPFTVIDDRPAFACRDRYPDSGEMLCGSFGEMLRKIDIGPETQVVIITRGHKYDLFCLREVIRRPAGYIGMIGSRKKVREVMGQLEREGVEKALLEKVYSPIGLDIGAETPEEIALSIIAEIVSVHRGGRGKPLKEETGWWPTNEEERRCGK